MVKTDLIQSLNRSYYHSQPLVAVFFGATTGIGENAVRTLSSICSDQTTPIRVYMTGRKQNAIDKIISDCARICPHADFRFVKANDLVSIKDVDRVCAEITRLEKELDKSGTPHVDLLVMTQGKLEFGPRIESPEGLDRSMSLLYYSRIRIIQQLLPLLLSTRSLPPNRPAKIISIYAGGMENSSFYPSDLSLRDPKHYSFSTCRSHVVHMKTMAFEHLAKAHAGKIALVHQFPGLVLHPGYDTSEFPWWFRMSYAVAGPVMRRTVSISPGENGERTLFCGTERWMARSTEGVGSGKGKPGGGGVEDKGFVATSTDGVRGGGAYAVNEKCETVTPKADYVKLRREGFEEKVWEHTMSAFKEIEKSGKFTG